MAEVALKWGVNINFSAYTWLRTNDMSLMIPREEIGDFRTVVEELIEIRSDRRGTSSVNIPTPVRMLFGSGMRRESGRELDAVAGGWDTLPGLGWSIGLGWSPGLLARFDRGSAGSHYWTAPSDVVRRPTPSVESPQDV